MDIISDKQFNELAHLSALSFEESEREAFFKDFVQNINRTSKITSYNGKDYDDTIDNNAVGMDDLREDIEGQSLEPEILQRGTKPKNNCYVIPRVME